MSASCKIYLINYTLIAKFATFKEDLWLSSNHLEHDCHQLCPHYHLRQEIISWQSWQFYYYHNAIISWQSWQFYHYHNTIISWQSWQFYHYHNTIMSWQSWQFCHYHNTIMSWLSWQFRHHNGNTISGTSEGWQMLHLWKRFYQTEFELQ